jgi:uncharacterized membrane protein YedE/YeeE
MQRLIIVKVLVGLLVVQFLLGVLTSMFTDFPADNPEEAYRQFGYLSLHVITGTLLLVLGVVFLYQAIKHKVYKREAISGLAAMVVAYGFGEIFVSTQNDLWSFLMAFSFIGALMPYARVMFSAAAAKKAT